LTGRAKTPDRLPVKPDMPAHRMHRIRRLAPFLYLVTAPLCWSGNVVLARGIHEQIPPVALAFWRWSVALCLLAPLGYRYARQDWPVAVRYWKIMLFLSLTGIAGFNTLLYKAVHTTTAVNSALIQTAMPAVIILISLALFRERVTAAQIAGAVLCIIGATWVVVRGEWVTLLALEFVQGDVLMMLAVILYAFYSTFLRKRPPIHPVSFMLFTFFLGLLGLFPIYLWERVTVGPFPLRIGVVSSIVYVAVFPSIVAYFCWNRGIERLGANRGGLFINLIPVFASIFAVFWLGETLQAFHAAGMLLIFSGMLLFNRKTKPK
jgi:drug/metabolite transporter (DMT)-like permease